MSSTVFRIVNDIKKIMLSSSISCCPHCGALIPPGSNKCEYCDMHVPRVEMDKIIDKLEGSLSVSLAKDELDAVLREAKSLLPTIREQSKLLFDEIDQNFRNLVEQKVNEVVEKAVSDVSDKLLRIEEEVSQLMIGLMDKLRRNSLNSLNVAIVPNASASQLNEIARVSDEAWGTVSVGVNEFFIAGFESSISLRRIGDFLYRAGRFDEAVKWYSRSMLSIMSPPSTPSDEAPLPRYALAEFIPFGALKISVWDIDGDGRSELIYVPSKEIGGLKIHNSVLNLGGAQWPEGLKIVEDGVSFPLVGKFSDDLNSVFLQWENVNFLDASIYSRSGDKIPVLSDGERLYSLPVYDASVGDLDGDGYQEIILFKYPSGIEILKYDNKSFKVLTRYFMGRVCTHIVADIDGNGLDEVVVVTNNGAIFIIKYRAKLSVIGLNGRLSDVNRVTMTQGSLMEAGKKEVYILGPGDGILQLREMDGNFNLVKIDEKSPISIATARIRGDEYIVSLDKSVEGYMLSFYSLEEVLGVASMTKQFEIPVYLPEQRELRSGGSNCNRNYFASRSISIGLDVEGDGVDEIFMGLDKLFIGIDLKF